MNTGPAFKILHLTNMLPTRESPYFGIFVARQINSLKNKGIESDVACIGPKYGGYKKIFGLSDKVKEADIIHCHFGHTGSLGLLWKALRRKPVVVSYYGTDLLGKVVKGGELSFKGKALAVLNSFLSRYADCAIVQSKELQGKVFSRRVKVIPCEVDASYYVPMDQDEAKEKIGLGGYDGKVIFFMGQENNPVKNFALLERAMDGLETGIKCISLGGVAQEDMVYYMNAADVCVLTSLQEGSPVVVREAMACNRPIVSVDVGDVKEILDGVEGCYVVGHDPEKLAEAIEKAFEKRSTSARDRLMALGLDSEGTAAKTIEVYENVLTGIKNT